MVVWLLISDKSEMLLNQVCLVNKSNDVTCSKWNKLNLVKKLKDYLVVGFFQILVKIFNRASCSLHFYSKVLLVPFLLAPVLK